MEQKISNYEKMKNSMADAFLQYDQERMIQKFCLDYDQDFLYICYLGREYRISRLSGAVSWSKDAFRSEEKADYNEAMTIYDVLCYSKENCGLAGEWVNVGSLSTVKGGTLKQGNDFFQHAAEYFDGKTEELTRACEKLHGRKIKRGDVAFELDFFPFLPIELRFWESDEEFSANLQFFTDRNILDYMHYETLMFALSHLLRRLREEM